MALWKIRPTKLDRWVADMISSHVTPGVERPLRLLTYGADEHILLPAALAFWIFSRRASVSQRRAVDHVTVNVIASALLPHLLKHLVDRKRPDRRVHGFRHGIPRSGKAEDAFPSGHAVHVGAIASAVSRCFPRYRAVAWSIGAALAASRVALLAHSVTDVAAGLALGVTIE